MNSQHTQGEWKSRQTLSKGTPWEIYNSSENTTLALITNLNKSGSVEANCKLMASAPDLLTALQNMVEEFEIFADIPKGYKDLAGWDGGENPKGLAIKAAILAIQKATNNQ